VSAKEIAEELLKVLYPTLDYPTNWNPSAQMAIEEAIERLMMRPACKPAAPIDHHGNLLNFRQRLLHQLTACLMAGELGKVAKIASAAAVIGDLLNMPAVKAYEIPF